MKIESPRLNHCVANTSWKKERRWGFCIVQKGFRNGFVWMSVGIVLVLGTEYNEAGIVSYFSGCSVITFRLLFCCPQSLFFFFKSKNKGNFKFQISPGILLATQWFSLGLSIFLVVYCSIWLKKIQTKNHFFFTTYHTPSSSPFVATSSSNRTRLWSF